MNPSIYFQGGTLVLKGVDEGDSVPAPFQWIKASWRCEAYHYPGLQEWLRAQGIRDTVPRWQRLDLDFHDERQPHDYQLESLDAWEEAGGRGSIVLPTGAGKTYVAIHAIRRLNRSALVNAQQC